MRIRHFIAGPVAARDPDGLVSRRYESMDRTLTIAVEKLASGGDGVAFDHGRVLFVPGALPGETVRARITETHRGYDRAELTEIITPSPDRVPPRCPLYGACGGCTLQHLAHSAQVREKASAAREMFRQFAGFDPGRIEVVSGEAYGYRNRLQLHVCADGGIGFMPAKGSGAIRAKGCPVAVRGVDAWLASVNRKSRPARELGAAYGERDRFVVFAQDDRMYLEGRDPAAEAVVAGARYRFPVGHFFQSNLEMASLVARDAIAGLSGERAADLYCGAGLFAKLLAGSFRELDCVESDAMSLEAARGNLEGGGARVKFSPEPVEKWASARGAHRDVRFDWVVADPPRQGLSPGIREWLARADVGGLSYVSCDPATLARDAGELAKSGFELDSLALYDFYPQTGHFEALARFHRRMP